MALLELKDLHTFFRTKKGIVKAVNGVSYSVEAGRTLGVVGESGSGKSVSAMSILQLLDGNGYIDSGEILFEGRDLTKLTEKEMYSVRGNDISVIFQEPMTSLNPVFTVSRQVSEPFIIHQGMTKKQAAAKVIEMLADVKIPNPHIVAKQYPHQLSGGMRQRVMIAMALACKPKLLIADEAVSALDVSVQAQIINLLEELQKSLHLTMLFISHDLSVVRCMTDRAVVMYLGKIMEMGPTEHLFGAPAHPYTRNLIDAVPEPDPDCPPKESTMIGEPPSPMDIPGGCRFHPRCPYAKNVCRRAQPELTDLGGGHFAACHFPYACAGAPQTEAEQ